MILLFFWMATALPAIAQQLTETKYWNSNGDSTGKDNASTYSEITYSDTTKTVYTTKYYTIEGRLKSEIAYRDSGQKRMYDGAYISYHENGTVKAKCTYVNDKLNGELNTWYNNQQPKRKDVYVLDSLITGHCYKCNGQDTAWFPYKIAFTYGSGLKQLYNYVSRNIVYPKTAYKKGIEGEVRVQFIIEKDGTLSHEKIRRSVSSDIDKEALRVLRSVPARWQPAFIDGEPQKGYAILPIVFKLDY